MLKVSGQPISIQGQESLSIDHLINWECSLFALKSDRSLTHTNEMRLLSDYVKHIFEALSVMRFMTASNDTMLLVRSSM